MEKTFKIKDLTYSHKDVRKISINDLNIGQICAGHIVHFFESRPNPVIFVHAGDPITEETIERLKKKKLKTLNICEAYDRITKDKIKKLLSEFKTMKFEEERAFHAQEIIKEVLNSSFYEKNGNLLDLIVSFQETFYSFPDDLTKSFFNVSTEDYIRSTEVAFFASFMALVMGYYDFKFMHDIYNLTFLLDISLQGDLSYNISLAKEHENSNGQEGIRFLSKLSPLETEQFKNHPKQSYQFAKKLGNVFHGRSILENILNQHEWADGSGFKGEEQRDFFDWEVILAFSDVFIGKKHTQFFKNDANKKYGLRLRDLRLVKNSRKKYFVRFLDRLQKYFDFYEEIKKEDKTA